MKVFRAVVLACLSLCLTIFHPFTSSELLPLQAQQAPIVASSLPTRLMPSSNPTDLNVLLPDWQRISFSSLPAIGQSGSVNIGSQTRTWTAGQTPDKYLRLGDIQEALRPDLLSLVTITRGNLDLKTIPLASFPLLSSQTLKQLVDVVPSLGQFSAKDVSPIDALLSSQTAAQIRI